MICISFAKISLESNSYDVSPILESFFVKMKTMLQCANHMTFRTKSMFQAANIVTTIQIVPVAKISNQTHEISRKRSCTNVIVKPLASGSIFIFIGILFVNRHATKAILILHGHQLCINWNILFKKVSKMDGHQFYQFKSITAR